MCTCACVYVDTCEQRSGRMYIHCPRWIHMKQQWGWSGAEGTGRLQFYSIESQMV